MKHVPYRGSGPAVTDLIAGHILAIMLPFGSQLAHLKAGRLRMLAQTGENRAASAPDVPSFKELGYPTLAFPGWDGIFAPAGTPAELGNRYNDAIVKTIRQPGVPGRMLAVEAE